MLKSEAKRTPSSASTGKRTIRRPVYLLTGLLLLSGCATPPRPVPEETHKEATIPHLDNVRNWGDKRPSDLKAWLSWDTSKPETLASISNTEHHYLALSGGGPYGAFGAGVLAGWTLSGERPEFTIVTGVSAGALQAPFAFLGSDYDDVLKEVFTAHSTWDLVRPRGVVSVVWGDGALNTNPLHELIQKHLNEKLIEKIAAEHRKGRRLYVGTTHLYAERPMIWDIGKIAQHKTPEARSLIHRILLASASMPGIFPPVMFQVDINGETFDEMHVDGGTTSTVFFSPTAIEWDALADVLDVKGKPRLYVLQNLYLDPTWQTVPKQTLPIAMRSVLSMIRAQGSGDIYRMYQTAKTDDIEFRLIHVPSTFRDQPKELFDPTFMKSLYTLGHDMGRKSSGWEKRPPGAE